jgi:hypothetical protein
MVTGAPKQNTLADRFFRFFTVSVRVAFFRDFKNQASTYYPIRIVIFLLGSFSRIGAIHVSAHSARGGKSPDLPFSG